MEAKLDKAFDDCVQQGEEGDPEAAEATADFFQKLLGPDSKVSEGVVLFLLTPVIVVVVVVVSHI